MIMEEPAAAQTFVLGWEEWASLTELGLPALKVKVDTGAKTSALHAFGIEPFGESQRRVRFGVHPVPGRDDIEVICTGSIVDRRQFTSSNGETEWRYVIGTRVKIGPREWPIEVSLTNRQAMSYRMLLGRGALGHDMVVNPALSYQQGILNYDPYSSIVIREPASPNGLRIALLTREPASYSSNRIKDSALARGHSVDVIDTARCYLSINSAAPAIHHDGEALPFYDAVIPRIGSSITRYGMAVVRQFEIMGTYCLNRAQAIGTSRDKLLAHQTLAQHRIPMPNTAFAHSTKDSHQLIDLVGGPPLVIKLLASTQGRGVVLAKTAHAAEAQISAFRVLDADFLVQDFIEESSGSDIRCLVVGERVVATMGRRAVSGDFRANLHMGGQAEPIKLTREERSIAVKAVLAMGLEVAGVDLLRAADGIKVLEVNSSPGLEGIEKLSGHDIGALMIEHIETRVRSSATVGRKARPRDEDALAEDDGEEGTSGSA
jgi:ribosomal protein S6--L-glutamate ligase